MVKEEDAAVQFSNDWAEQRQLQICKVISCLRVRLLPSEVNSTAWIHPPSPSPPEEQLVSLHSLHAQEKFT